MQIQVEQSKELKILTESLEKMRNKFNNALGQREDNQSNFIDNHLAYGDVMGGLKNNMSQAKNIEKYMKELNAQNGGIEKKIDMQGLLGEYLKNQGKASGETNSE